jgi:hypothetical protein
MLVFLSELWEYLCVIPLHELSLITGLCRILMLSLLSLGLTMGIG